MRKISRVVQGVKINSLIKLSYKSLIVSSENLGIHGPCYFTEAGLALLDISFSNLLSSVFLV